MGTLKTQPFGFNSIILREMRNIKSIMQNVLVVDLLCAWEKNAVRHEQIDLVQV